MLKNAFSSYEKFHDVELFKEYYEEMLLAVSNAGYYGVDVTSHEVQIIGTEYIKDTLKRNRLFVSSYIYFDYFAKSDNEINKRIEEAKTAVDIAKELGTEIIMLVPVSHKGIEMDRPEAIRANLINHWTPIAEYAVQNGLHPVVEDTPDLRMCFCKAAEVKDVMDAVPGLELVYDSGNMILDGEDPIEYAKEFIGRIGYVHLKDIKIMSDGSESRERMRDGRPTICVPTGMGIVDIKGVVGALLDMGYKGGMTVEYAKHSGKTYPDSLRKSREYVETYMRR